MTLNGDPQSNYIFLPSFFVALAKTVVAIAAVVVAAVVAAGVLAAVVLQAAFAIGAVGLQAVVVVAAVNFQALAFSSSCFLKLLLIKAVNNPAGCLQKLLLCYYWCCLLCILISFRVLAAPESWSKHLFPYCIQNDVTSQLFSLSLGLKKTHTIHGSL